MGRSWGGAWRRVAGAARSMPAGYGHTWRSCAAWRSNHAGHRRGSRWRDRPMAERPGAEVMIRQVERLAADLRDLTGIFGARAAALLAPPRGERAEKVYLTGDGDSYHASGAAAMAFETIADIPCPPGSPLRFRQHRAPRTPPPP